MDWHPDFLAKTLYSAAKMLLLESLQCREEELVSWDS